MSKCPHCKKKISRLNCISECYQRCNLDDDGKMDYANIEEIGETIYYECSYCCKKICESEEIAILFLQGKDIKKLVNKTK